MDTIRNSIKRRTGAAGAALVLAAGLTVAGGTPAAAYTPAVTFAGVAGYDRGSSKDLIARDKAGLLWLYPGQSTRGYSSLGRFRIGNGWNAMTFAGVADYDRDGSQDIVARDDGTSKLWLYPGQSTRGYSGLGRFEIGNGWNAMTFAGVADYDRDGKQDIVARDDGTGKLWLYPGQSTRGYSSFSRSEIGNGWQGMTFAGIADYDHDGSQDIIARERSGLLWLYPGESTRGYSGQGRFEIGNGWNAMTYAGVADYDRDGKQDIVARDNGTGKLWLYPGQSTRGYSSLGRFEIGNGW
jgi:hypothetical protein